MISPALHSLMVDARITELRRAARARRATTGRPRRLSWRRQPAVPAAIGLELAVTIRYAFPDDRQALTRLATLDSSVAPRAPVLLAEVDGELWAALSLGDGTAVADPFRRTTALIELLRARADQLRADGVVRRRGSSVRGSWQRDSLRRGGATMG